jgi:hypothetical protein
MSTLPPYSPPPPIKEGRGVLFWVATGCSGCLVALAVFVAFIYAIVATAMSNSAPVNETMRRARANPQVAAALGTPLDTGWVWLGNLNFENQTGSIDVAFTIKGPKGKAGAHVTGFRRNDRWTYQEMSVDLPDGTKIDLRDPTRERTGS